MPLMTEKRLRLGGFEFSVATDAERADRIRRSLPYRALVGPALRWALGQGRRSRAAAPAAPAPGPQPTAWPGTAPAAPPAGDARAAEMWARVSQIRWYHTIDLGHGVVTPGFVDHRHVVDRCGLPASLAGKRCLDVGTFDGFWAFEMERRGAAEVVALDLDSPADYDVPRRLSKEQLAEGARAMGFRHPGEGFALAKELLGSRAQRRGLNVYDLSPQAAGTFDMVFVSELLLHLRDPQTALENIFSVCRDFAIVAEPFNPALERFNVPLSEFVGTAVYGIWWLHSSKSWRRMMEIAGFDAIEEVTRLHLDNLEGDFWKVVLKGRAPAPPAGRPGAPA